jgi:hypothetical protein
LAKPKPTAKTKTNCKNQNQLQKPKPTAKTKTNCKTQPRINADERGSKTSDLPMDVPAA